MKTIKTYHIHTDYKFVNSIGRFEGGNFENFNIFISDDSEVADSLGSDILTFKTSELEQIIRLCSIADLVVLYDLDLFKSKLALSLPKEVKIAWRFFGYELYSRDRDKFISEKTYKALLYDGKSLIERIHPIARRIYCHTYIPGTNVYLFKKAVSKIDVFLGLSLTEYNLLKKRWKYLPPFIKLSSYPPKSEKLSLNIDIKQTKRTIVLGNSKSYYNNHLDIIDIVEGSEKKKSYNFKILFNYGLENAYTEKIREVCSSNEYYTFIEDFMHIKDFITFYKQVSALVLNNYRQMSMGNIRIALINGVKIYLSKKNIFYHELKSYGFTIFELEELKDDLNSGSIHLSLDEAKNNFDKLIEVANMNSKFKFQMKLQDFIKAN